MQLHLPDYIDYIQRLKKGTSPKTIAHYKDTLKRIGIDDIDSDKLPALYKILRERLDKHGYVYTKCYLAIVSAWLHKNGQHLTKELTFYTLMDEIKNKVGTKEAYTDSDVAALFAVAEGNSELQKLLILMMYSGLRVGAAYPIHYKDFAPVDGFSVYAYPVVSKGVRYHALISKRAYEALIRLRGVNQDLVVQHDDGYTSPFDSRYREMLNTCLKQLQEDGVRLRKGKSLFHSLRKTYSQKLLLAGIEPTDYDFKALMGHIPKSTMATKYYITPGDSSPPPELLKRLAAAYSKTPLMTMGVGL